MAVPICGLLPVVFFVQHSMPKGQRGKEEAVGYTHAHSEPPRRIGHFCNTCGLIKASPAGAIYTRLNVSPSPCATRFLDWHSSPAAVPLLLRGAHAPWLVDVRGRHAPQLGQPRLDVLPLEVVVFGLRYAVYAVKAGDAWRLKRP